MTGKPLTVSERTRQLLREEAERPLPVEEFLRRINIPMSERGREEGQALIRWFKRRYPTAADRLRYARQADQPWATR